MTDFSMINPSEYSILVCDDEESIRSVVGEAVGSWGFQVATAPNGEAALEYLKAGNIPHIILTDIRMGGMTGIDLAAKAKEISDEIQIIIMTSHGSFQTAVQAMRLGVYDYLSKPFDNIEDVRTVLLHVCHRIYLKLYSEFLVGELQRKNSEIEKLAKVTEELSQNLDLEKCIEISCRGISEAFDKSPTVFFQYLPQQKSLLATNRCPETLFGGAQPQMLLPIPALESKEALMNSVKELSHSSEFLKFLTEASRMNPQPLWPNGKWVVRELLSLEEPRGIFATYVKKWNEEESSALLGRYIQSVGAAFENAILHALVVETSIRDGLTQLYNVRFFKERIAQEILLANRYQHPVSLLFLDVDHFKKYNDRNGHPAGDQVLKTIAELMRKNFRGTDILARYGGEEFVILLTHTALPDALQKAETFRESVELEKFPHGENQPLGKVTVSIGVSEFPSNGASAEAIIEAADQALYKGKKTSRNVVHAAEAPEAYVSSFKSESKRTKTKHP